MAIIYSDEVKKMCTVKQGVAHGAAEIPEEALWVKAKDVKDISGVQLFVGKRLQDHSFVQENFYGRKDILLMQQQKRLKHVHSRC